MAKIPEHEARKRFNEGLPVRLVQASGFVPYGYVSCVTASWRSFDEHRTFVLDHFWRTGDNPMHWERPQPSRRTMDEALGHVFRHEEFEIGNLSGTHFFVPWGTRGVLPEKYRLDFMRAEYAVWSFETPIAWTYENGGVMMPPVRYSNTTTEHQYSVARALGVRFAATDGSFRKGKGKTPFTQRSW